MNEIRYSKVLVVLCCLALHIATLSAQNDSVRFFNEVDTSFCKVHVGQDVRVGYYSTGEIYDMSVPRWDDCEAGAGVGPAFYAVVKDFFCKRQAGESFTPRKLLHSPFQESRLGYSAFGTGHDRREDAYLLYDEGLRASCREYRRSGL